MMTISCNQYVLPSNNEDTINMHNLTPSILSELMSDPFTQQHM